MSLKLCMLSFQRVMQILSRAFCKIIPGFEVIAVEVFRHQSDLRLSGTW